MAGAEKVRPEQQWQETVARLQEQALELLHLPPLLIHVALVLIVGSIADHLNLNLPFVFTLGFMYLCHIESSQRRKIETRIRSDERKLTDRKRLLSDAETARWLNNVVESMWPVFLEHFASAHFLMRIAPWFLEKYKPWTAKKIVLHELYLGRSPPVFTNFRAGRYPTDGDHLVLEMTMNFAASEDMRASMGVQMAKRVGLGMWTTIHVSGIQAEGKIKVGVRFVRGWPVISRLRISFSSAPVIRMVAKPIFTHGVDVTDLPGIAVWMDKMIAEALDQSLVEPNMLVVDVEKLVGDLMSVNAKLQKLQGGKTHNPDCSAAGDWFSVQKKDCVAILLVEILEGDRLKPCDPNGKSDPYVKLTLEKTEYMTTIKRKTLSPSWYEKFSFPIASWDQHNMLHLRVRDKDRFSDDEMGTYLIPIEHVRDGERHDMWLHLDGVKTGRLHVALTVEEMPTAHDHERNTVGSHSPNSDDGRDGGSTTSVARSGRVPLSRTVSESITEAKLTDSNEGSGSDETPVRDEGEFVDVGVGQPGSVSIVTPGRHMVKEEYSSERSRQRRMSFKGRNSRSRDGKLGKSGPLVVDELETLPPDVATSVAEPEAKKSRMRKLLGRRQSSRKDVRPDHLGSGDLSDGNDEVVAVGHKGTAVHMKLDLDENGD